jgi:hypothetical protein
MKIQRILDKKIGALGQSYGVRREEEEEKCLHDVVYLWKEKKN